MHLNIHVIFIYTCVYVYIYIYNIVDKYAAHFISRRWCQPIKNKKITFNCDRHEHFTAEVFVTTKKTNKKVEMSPMKLQTEVRTGLYNLI